MKIDNIPAQMAALPQWVCWGAPNKARKCPYNPRTDYPAKAGHPDTWADLYTAVQAVQGWRYEGVGFEFNGGGIVGIDIDHCIKNGKLDAWAADWVEKLDSYTEVSPSGEGLHIFCTAQLPGPAIKRPECEMYDRDRYFTVTGRSWGPVCPLREAQEAVNELYRELQARATKEDRPTQQPVPPALTLPDKNYLQIGLEKDTQLAVLWRGDRPNGNESADDMALLNKLAYWCSCDPAAMQAAFLTSGHYHSKDEAHKKKVQRKDYLPRSIERAVKDCTRTAAQNDAAYQNARAREAFGRTEYTGQSGTVQQRPQLSTISARELQDKDIPPANFVVVDLLPQGLSLLASPPKYGKSWFVLDLCLSVAAGERFLNHQTVKRGCLYLALEDSERRLKDRMNKVLCGRRAPMGFDYATSALDIEGGLLEQLEAYLEQHKDTGLIVIDTLQKVRSSTGGKENAYSADYRESGRLKTFADRYGVCLLVVHHLRKARDDTDPFNQISGTNGIFGAVDTAMVMTRAKRGDERTTLSVIGRDIDSSETALTFDKSCWKWKSLGSLEDIQRQADEDAYKTSPVVITIRELLRQSPTGTWTGSMKQLLEAGQVITGTWIAANAKELANQVKTLEHNLFEYDRIMHRRLKNGTGGGKHWFGLSTAGSLVGTVGVEQQIMEGTTPQAL